MTRQILAVSVQDDPHIDMVNKYLPQPIVVFDPSNFLNSDITYRLQGRRFCVVSDGVEYNSVSSVWFRKPIYLKASDFPVAEEYQLFARSSYYDSVRAMYDLLRDKFWLSDYRSIMKANNKLFQLEVASDLGFLVPETIVTSNPHEAMRFHQDLGHIITKSLVFEPVYRDGEVFTFFATAIGPTDEVDYSGLGLAPAMFQREVRNKMDLRVTFVGDQAFCCVPKLRGAQELDVDWRTGISTDEVDYSVFEDFPSDLEQKCRQLLRVLGLSYGAVEFAIDEFGQYWFLEINPNGQWAFVELNTGLPIASAVAEILST